ncbi:MAG: diguanylate cyclase [Selenomonadaceae bacterium]|nr:diguanylate cyclase [Selenomonadaceae bacterium]
MQKILIVDDEKMMLKLATRILSKNYEIVCASSGAEAIKLFEIEKPDMILSDLLMPEMDGYELHRILNEKSAESVPIMFMTADESDESESHGFEIGAADYIRKPLKADILLRRVANILDNADKIHGLKKAADIDKMTGLLNKTAVQREIDKICKNSQGALLMIDLDSFKLVNDIYGHNMGDMILIKFAELINSIIRSTDIAGRMGGDEFIAFCENVEEESIIFDKTKYLNEKILESAKKYMGEDMNIPLGVSVGAAFVPSEGTDFSKLYKKADKALYKVKQNGKHGYAIYSEDKKNNIPHKSEVSDIKQILGERSEAHGAYFVALDYFKVVYRLFVRLADNYKKDIQFMKITLANEYEKDLETLKELLIKTLRKSDCITQNGSNQIFVLLMETSKQEAEVVKNRIINKIMQSEKLTNNKIDFYSESI